MTVTTSKFRPNVTVKQCNNNIKIGTKTNREMSFKAKRNRHKVKPGLALPACLSSGAIHKGTYNGMAVEVGNSVAMQDLQENGCFGMSTGGRTTGTTSADDGTGSLTDSTQAKLLLFPEEALFLAHSIKCLEIRNKDDEIMSGEDCLEEFCRIHPEFISSFVAYSYLRSKNWVTKSGIKFGGDFRKKFSSKQPLL